MCRNQSEGGARCASHTRPAYQTATFGTAQWDDAAAAYASTPTGRMELLGSHAAAEEARDIPSVIAFEHALATGQRLREKSELFRDELAAYTAPPVEALTLAVPLAQQVAEYEPYNYDEEEDQSFAHEATDYDDLGSAIDDHDEARNVAWSPDMRGQRWSANDTAFAGCSPTMTSDQFVNRVCENVGVSRAEFEAAAAEYLQDNYVNLVAPLGDGMVDYGFTGGGSGLNAAQLRTALLLSATPRFNPQQVKEIAELARQRRDAINVDTPPAPSDATEAENNTRPGRLVLPNDLSELAELSASPDDKTREGVAGHANTPAYVLTRLTNDENAKVRTAATRNENLPLETLVPLASHRLVGARAAAARNPSMPGEMLVRLAEDVNDSVVGAVARNPSTHAALYAALAQSESATVRKHAARRKDIAPDIAERLSQDADQQVRSTLARNRTTSAAHLRSLARDETHTVRAYTAGNRNLPPTLLHGRLSRDTTPGVRAAVAGNPNTPVTVLTRLSTDTDPWVRRNVAWNEKTPAVLLYALARDTNDGVRSEAVSRTPQG